MSDARGTCGHSRNHPGQQTHHHSTVSVQTHHHSTVGGAIYEISTVSGPTYSKTCPYRNALGTNFYSGLDRFRFGEGFCFRRETKNDNLYN